MDTDDDIPLSAVLDCPATDPRDKARAIETVLATARQLVGRGVPWPAWLRRDLAQLAEREYADAPETRALLAAGELVCWVEPPMILS